MGNVTGILSFCLWYICFYLWESYKKNSPIGQLWSMGHIFAFTCQKFSNFTDWQLLSKGYIYGKCIYWNILLPFSAILIMNYMIQQHNSIGIKKTFCTIEQKIKTSPPCEWNICLGELLSHLISSQHWYFFLRKVTTFLGLVPFI